jgi:hypothetical protein
MALELHVDSTRPIDIAVLLHDVSALLADMLAVHKRPDLSVNQLERAAAYPIAPSLLTAKSKTVLVSIDGERGAVSLTTIPSGVTVPILGSRSRLQCALGAAIAIVLANEANSKIWDDQRFFTENVQTCPEALRARLTLATRQKNLREATSLLKFAGT